MKSFPIRVILVNSSDKLTREVNIITIDKGSHELIAYLIRLDKPKTIMTISKELNQSRRKIYYHLDKINEALPSNIPSIVSFPRIGIVLNDDQKKACKDMLDKVEEYDYAMSAEERVNIIIIYIAISQERVTIERLMNLVDVSRNTILNDLNNIRQRLETTDSNYEMKLKVTKANGYYFDAYPVMKFQYVYQLLYSIHEQKSHQLLKFLRHHLLEEQAISIYFSESLKDYMNHRLSQLREDIGKSINRQDQSFIVTIFPYLISSYKNMALTPKIRSEVKENYKMIINRLEYKQAQKIADGVQNQFEIVFDEIDNFLIALLMISVRKNYDEHLESHDYDEIRNTLNVFVDDLIYHKDLQFINRSKLIDQLLRHCKALLFRKNFKIFSVNPMTQHIKRKYKSLFKVCEESIQILEKAWNIKFVDDDIAYIVIHIGGQLERTIDLEHPRQKVFIVCDEGISVQQLMAKQCQTYLSYVTIEGIFTSEQFQSIAEDVEADLIISTSDVIESMIPIIVVHPIISDEDIVKLIRFSNKYIKSQEFNFSEELETSLRSYISDDGDLNALKSKIEMLVNRELLINNRIRKE